MKIRPRTLAPSASPTGLLSSVPSARAVLLPERFRGGYAFGAGCRPGPIPVSPARAWETCCICERASTLGVRRKPGKKSAAFTVLCSAKRPGEGPPLAAAPRVSSAPEAKADFFGRLRGSLSSAQRQWTTRQRLSVLRIDSDRRPAVRMREDDHST